MKPNFLIIAGGTGGHISPGIAIYEELKKDGHTCIFVSLKKNKYYPEFEKKKIPVKFIVSPKFSFQLNEIFLFFPLFIYATFQSILILIKNKVQILISMGGYPAVPMLLAGIFLRKKIYLCEQNVIPGRVTKIFYRFAKKVFLTFPIEGDLSNDHRFLITGSPFREELFEFATRFKKKNTKRKTIFIIGGSQGALQLNHMILNFWQKYPEESKKFNWILQTGEKHLKEVIEKKESLSFKNQIICFGFSTNIYEYFAKADILVCRAGSGILNEAILFGIPMIAIPFPYAKDNHQLKNAEYIEKKHFGISINTNTTDPHLLWEALKKMIHQHSFFLEHLSKNRILLNPSQIIKKEII